MNIHQSPVLFQHEGEGVYLFTLKNKRGVEISISNLGAIIQSFIVPDRSGKAIDIVLGFDKMEQYLDRDYIQSKTYLGAIIGRYANRIGNACFEIDGQFFPISANLPPHQLHGGNEGFDRKVWKSESIEQYPNAKLTLSYLSRDGEEGFPGNLNVKTSFELTEDNELIILTEAGTDKPTAINLTHHDYFNLNGSGPIAEHWVMIPSTYYLGQDADYVATGNAHSVSGTVFNFNSSKQIEQDWDEWEGYDQSFVLDKEYRSWGLAARAFSEKSRINLEVYTDEPTVHLYTGKYLNIKNGKKGMNYPAFSGLCFETQHHTNAINIPSFPGTILRPGEVYKQKTTYRVSLNTG